MNLIFCLGVSYSICVHQHSCSVYGNVSSLKQSVIGTVSGYSCDNCLEKQRHKVDIFAESEMIGARIIEIKSFDIQKNGLSAGELGCQFGF